MQFDYENRYKKRKENVVMNAFSRCNSLTSVVLSNDLMAQIQDGWQQDSHLQAIIATKLVDSVAFSKYE